MALNTRLRTITPDEARKLLERNTGNRTPRQNWIDQLAQLIKAGKWAITHQGIAISNTGRLLDGQHRLLAIVQAGIPVDMYVTSGLDDEIYRWIDGGRSRTHADRLHLVDNPTINRLAAGVASSYIRCSMGHQTPQVDAVEDVFIKFTDSVLYAASVLARKVRGVTTMPVGAALACYHVYNATQAVEAAEMLLTGQNMIINHPILTLREALIAKRVRTDSEIYWKAIGAFRAHDDGREMKMMVCATKDFLGNIFDRLHERRRQWGVKGYAARKANAEAS